MIKELLKDRIYKSVSPLFEDIDFDLTSIDLDLTKNPMHGDFATNLALKFAKKINLKPMDLGNKISILLNRRSNCRYFGAQYLIKKGNFFDLDYPWAWKDPRNIFTLPFWVTLFPSSKNLKPP